MEVYEGAVLVQRVALDPKIVGKLLVTDVMVGGASWNADESPPRRGGATRRRGAHRRARGTGDADIT